MRIGKGIWVGLAIALLAGVGEAASQATIANPSAGNGGASVTVPVGHVGDRLAYVTFQRASSDSPWKRATETNYQITGLGRVPDQTQLMHDVVFLSTNTGSSVDEGREYSVTLSTRDWVRIQDRYNWSSPEFSVLNNQDRVTQYDYGPETPNAELLGPQTHVKVPLLTWQGKTYRVGDDAQQLVPQLLAMEAQTIHWWVGAVDLFGLDAHGTVSSAGLVGDVPAVAATLDGCVDLKVSDPDPRNTYWYSDPPEVYFLGMPTPVPSHVCFSLTTWLSGQNPYPLLTETRSTIDGKIIGESMETLAAYRPGTQEIPWQATAESYRPANPSLERTASGQGFPGDGQGTQLVYPLSAAVAAVERDPSLLRFTAWRIEHPTSRLIGAFLVPSGPDGQRQQWRLTYGMTDGKTFVVLTERAIASGVATQTEAGEFDLYPFTRPTTPPITFAAAMSVWRTAFGESMRDVVPNSAGWGYLFHPDIQRCPTVDTCTTWSAGFYSGSDLNSMSLFFARDEVSKTSSLGNTGYSPGALYLNATSGALYANREGFRTVRISPLAVAPDLEPRSVATAENPRTPKAILESAAAVSASVFAVALLAYFFPLLKWAGGNALVAFPGYAKLHKADVLNNKVRDAMVQAIKADPGITPPQLQTLTGAGWSTVVYHLGVLEKNKLVSSLIDGRHKRFFPVDHVNWSDRGRIAALRNQQSRQLYELILQEPGVGPSDLSHRVGVSRSTIYWHVERLEKAGLVGRDRHRLKTAFFANPEPAKPYDARDAVEVS